MPKADTPDVRLVIDMRRSFVNEYIAKTLLKFTTVDMVLSRIKQGWFLAKLDVSDAYMRCAIHPIDYRLCGIYFEGSYYFFTRLPFGARSSPWQLARLANAVKRRVSSIFVSLADDYLDDYVMAHADQHILLQEWQQAHGILDHLGLNAKHSKSTAPTTLIVFLGIIIDTVNMIISLKQSKLQSILAVFLELSSKPTLTFKQLQSLIGKLQWVGRV